MDTVSVCSTVQYSTVQYSTVQYLPDDLCRLVHGCYILVDRVVVLSPGAVQSTVVYLYLYLRSNRSDSGTTRVCGVWGVMVCISIIPTEV